LHWLKQSWTWLKWPFALGLIGFLIYQNRAGLMQLWSYPDKHWSLLLVAFAFCFCSTLLTFYRWYLLVVAQGFDLRFRDALRLGFVGLIGNYVTPLGSVGGDLTKAFLLARQQISRRTVAVATVVLDRVLGLLALFIVGSLASLLPVSVPQTKELQTVQWLLWFGSVSGLIGLGVMLHPASIRWAWIKRLTHLPVVGRRLGELLHGVMLYQSRPAAVVSAVVISLCGHIGLILSFYCCARALLPWYPNLITHYFFMPPAETFAAFFPTPGGIGGLEGAVQWFYQRLADGTVTQAQAGGGGFLATIAFRVVGLLVAAVGTVYYFSSRADIQRATGHEAQSDAREVAASPDSVPSTEPESPG
jgi:uncharacterized membrane protein YbhN (UPF0104 family)